MPLDLLESDLAITADAGAQKKYAVQNNPPRIIYSTTPAVLALIDGKPVLGPEQDHLQKVINTRALIVYDTSKYTYYLALMDGWMEAPTIEGPYTVAKHDPTKELKKIRQAAQTSDSNQPLGNPQQSLEEAYGEDEMPTVYVSTVPAELLLTQGQPQLTPILGTSLLYVSNTGNDIFMDSANNNYYILLAGRWFSSTSLQNGPWAYVSATEPARGLREDSGDQPEGQRAGFGSGNAAGERGADRELDSADGGHYAHRGQAERDVFRRAGLSADPGHEPDLRGEHGHSGHLRAAEQRVLRGAERRVVHLGELRPDRGRWRRRCRR